MTLAALPQCPQLPHGVPNSCHLRRSLDRRHGDEMFGCRPGDAPIDRHQDRVNARHRAGDGIVDGVEDRASADGICACTPSPISVRIEARFGIAMVMASPITARASSTMGPTWSTANMLIDRCPLTSSRRSTLGCSTAARFTETATGLGHPRHITGAIDHCVTVTDHDPLLGTRVRVQQKALRHPGRGGNQMLGQIAGESGASTARRLATATLVDSDQATSRERPVAPRCKTPDLRRRRRLLRAATPVRGRLAKTLIEH